jgi:hypothetical protein
MERRPPFGTEDLPPAEPSGDLAGSLALGRELEALAAEPVPALGVKWVDGVMAAVALEPAPQPVVAAGNALRAGRPGALLAAIVDAWRVGFGGGRPMLVRLPALALVLVAIVGLGSVATLGGYAGGRALGFFPDATPVVPAPTPSPTPAPSPSPTPIPSPTAQPTPTPTPSARPSVTATEAATQTASPGESGELETEDPSDDGGNSGPGSGNSGSGSGSSGSGSDD